MVQQESWNSQHAYLAAGNDLHKCMQCIKTEQKYKLEVNVVSEVCLTLICHTVRKQAHRTCLIVSRVPSSASSLPLEFFLDYPKMNIWSAQVESPIAGSDGLCGSGQASAPAPHTRCRCCNGSYHAIYLGYCRFSFLNTRATAKQE